MGRKRTSRIYLKDGRWYGDFRDYKQQGGRQRHWCRPIRGGQRERNPQARSLAASRLRELKRLRKAEVKVVVTRDESTDVIDLTRLGDFADHHLECEALLTENTSYGTVRPAISIPGDPAGTGHGNAAQGTMGFQSALSSLMSVVQFAPPDTTAC